MSTLLEQVAQPQDQLTTIYGLVDPITGYVRYVGKAIKPIVRFRSHLTPKQVNAKTHKARWIRGVLVSGHKPELILLEKINGAEWEEAERKWIAYYHSIPGYPPLTNATFGGESGKKGYTHSREIKEKIRLSKLGTKCSAEARKRMSEAHIARLTKMSSEERKRVLYHPFSWTTELREKVGKLSRQREKSPNMSSQFIGVDLLKKTGRWRATLCFKGERIRIGHFREEIDAARARDRKIIELSGDGYRLNFPRSEYA